MNTMVSYPQIERGLLLMSIQEAAMTREWLHNLGKRDSFQKLGHLFCELSLRFDAVRDGAIGRGVDVPLTQVDLADTIGLTTVHVNRVLQRFRRERLLDWSRHRFEILDFERLAHESEFNPRYLGLNKREHEPRALAYG
jgi:CRP-like cAMP-binding protein